VTRTPLSRSKGQRSRSPGRFIHRGLNESCSCSGERWNVLGVGNYCYFAVCWAAGGGRFGAHRGRRGAGAYRGGRPPTACWYRLHFSIVDTVRFGRKGSYSIIRQNHMHKCTQQAETLTTSISVSPARISRRSCLPSIV